jgi:hypothetical protein
MTQGKVPLVSAGPTLLFLVLNGLDLLLLLYDRLRCFNRAGRLFLLGQAQPSLRHVGQNGSWPAPSLDDTRLLRVLFNQIECVSG